MALFFFHLRDGDDNLLDPDGREMGGTDEIVSTTLNEARLIMSHDVRDGRLRLDQRIDVEDNGGRVVHCLQFEDAIEIVRDAARR